MKLFTKAIDEMLFKQYPLGSDLSSQMVVAKIFNPYGRGTWYLLNSDPQDPDYIWAIVDLFDVEMGSVSRSELEGMKVPPFRLGLERDTFFTPINALTLYQGLMEGKMYKDGGVIKWQDVYVGDSANVKSENKTGLIIQTYGRKFHLKFVDGSEKTYDASELEFIKDDDEFADGGEMSDSKEDFLEDVRELHEDIAEITLKDGTKISNEELMMYGHPKMADGGEMMGSGGNIKSNLSSISLRAKELAKKYGKKGFEKSKEIVKENKRKTAVNVINQTENKTSGKVNKEALDKARKLVIKNYADGGSLEDFQNEMKKRNIDVRSKIVQLIGIDETLNYLQKDYVISPFKLIDYAIARGYITTDDITSDLWFSALEEAEEIDEDYRDSGEGIGSSDMGYFVRTMLDNAGIEVKMADGGGIGFIPMDLEEDLRITAKWGGTDIKGVIGILNAMIDSGLTDEDLKPKPTKSGSARQNASDKKTKEIWAKIEPQYKGDFKGNMYFSTIRRLVERANSTDYILKKYKPFRKYQKFEEGGEMMADGGILIPQQGTLYTKDKKSKLEYYKKGNDYAFKVYDVENNPVENYTRNQYKKRSDEEALMTYNQFINYLYSELYIDDKMADGGGVNSYSYAKTAGKESQDFEKSAIEYVGGIKEWNKLTNEEKRQILVEEEKSWDRQYAMGGETTFDDKVKAVKSSLLKRKKVAPQVQKDYGKTYSPKEAEESAKRIVGSRVAKWNEKIRKK